MFKNFFIVIFVFRYKATYSMARGSYRSSYGNAKEIQVRNTPLTVCIHVFMVVAGSVRKSKCIYQKRRKTTKNFGCESWSGQFVQYLK